MGLGRKRRARWDKLRLSGVGWGWAGLGLERGWAYIGGPIKCSNTSIRPARWDKVALGLSGVGWEVAHTLGGNCSVEGLKCAEAGTVGQSRAKWGWVGLGWGWRGVGHTLGAN